MSEIMVRFDDLRRYCEKRHCGSVPLEYIKQMPTIEAEPVRHGRRIECNYRTLENGYIESYKASLCCYCCSECLTGFKKNHMTYKAFCPACGAKMDATDTNVGGKGDEEMDLSPLDFLAAEYDRKHPQGIRFVDCMEGADDGACKKV